MNAHAGAATRATLEPDAEQARVFIDALFRHADRQTYISLRAFDDHREGAPALFSEPVTVGDPQLLDLVVERMRQAAGHPRPHVFCPPVATFVGSRRATAADLANGIAISVECDAQPSEAWRILSELLGDPTIVVASGGEWLNETTGEIEPKLHLHWRLAKPTTTAPEHTLLREARQLATKLVGADGTAVSIVHPLRWPGSWHRKAVPKLVRIVASTDSEIELEQALAALRGATGTSSGPRKHGTLWETFAAQNRKADDLLDIVGALAVIPNEDLSWKDWNDIGMAIWVASTGTAFSAFDMWSGKSAKYDAQTTLDRWQHYFTSPPSRIGAGTLFHLAMEAMPGWTKPSAARTQSSFNGPSDKAGTEGESKEKCDGAASASQAPYERPVIRVVDGDLPRAADEAEQALLASGLPVFVRAGTLVRPIIDAVPASKGRMTTVAKFGDISADAALDLLSQAAVFQRYDGRRKDWATVNPPPNVIAILLAREGRWRMPRAAGIISTPTLRPDGSLLAATGYDELTRLYLVPDDSLKLPAIDDQPTREQAETALALLTDLLSGFPFVSATDRAVALSGLITAVVRGAVPVAPLHAIRAHTPGTGKSFLVDCAAMIATGRPCPVIAAGKTEEETEKRLGALLRDGAPIISLDNVSAELGGDALCQMTERPVVRIRILGRSEVPEFECKATVFATGNNLLLVGDMTRRALLCSLDAKVERPELREFDFDPGTRIREARGEYVAAALTIVRAYLAAGSPRVCSAIGSYADWSTMVRSPLVWLGEADPVKSMELARNEDPELGAIRELFGHWREHLELLESYTTSKIITAACHRAMGMDFTRPEFRDVLIKIAGEGGAVASKRLGKWLSKIAGRVVDGHVMSVDPDSSHGNRYALSPAKAPL